MARFQKTRNVLKNNFNLRKWSDIDRIQADSLGLLGFIKRLFQAKPKTRVESFEQAMARMNLTEQTIGERKTALFRLTCMMLFFAGLAFMYCIYSLVNHAYLASIMTFMITLVALTLAFRYHFWYFQMARRKLGASIQDWLAYILKGKAA